MNSRNLNIAVAAMDSLTVRKMLNLLAALEIEVIKKPTTGLVMMNVNDCFNTDFHLGEILVTTAEVRCGSRNGYGVIMGDESERALLLGCLDALLDTSNAPVILDIEKELDRWLLAAEKLRQNESRRAAATRVNFESMVEG